MSFPPPVTAALLLLEEGGGVCPAQSALHRSSRQCYPTVANRLGRPQISKTVPFWLSNAAFPCGAAAASDDIFWVFISGYFFKKSVMVAVATGGGGESLPMLFMIPHNCGCEQVFVQTTTQKQQRPGMGPIFSSRSPSRPFQQTHWECAGARRSPKQCLSGSQTLPFLAVLCRYSLLGLGDIVIPGLLLSLMIRYDYSSGKVIRGR